MWFGLGFGLGLRLGFGIGFGRVRAAGEGVVEYVLRVPMRDDHHARLVG